MTSTDYITERKKADPAICWIGLLRGGTERQEPPDAMSRLNAAHRTKPAPEWQVLSPEPRWPGNRPIGELSRLRSEPEAQTGQALRQSDPNSSGIRR